MRVMLSTLHSAGNARTSGIYWLLSYCYEVWEIKYKPEITFPNLSLVNVHTEITLYNRSSRKGSLYSAPFFCKELHDTCFSTAEPQMVPRTGEAARRLRMVLRLFWVSEPVPTKSAACLWSLEKETVIYLDFQGSLLWSWEWQAW